MSVGSSLLVVNRPSGSGRAGANLNALAQAFRGLIGPAAHPIVAVTANHDEVVECTRAFLSRHLRPWHLIAAGGGGTLRAVVQGIFESVVQGEAGLEDITLSTLRLGSGNLVARHLGVPHDPLEALRHIAEALRSSRAAACCVYRCRLFDEGRAARDRYGLALGGIGQFARVPDDIAGWKAAHPVLMRLLSRTISLERINTAQYLGFVGLRALRCALRAAEAEAIEVRHAGSVARYRLLSGLLLNFDDRDLPFQSGVAIAEPRLTLCCVPRLGGLSTLGALANWRSLDDRALRYTVTFDTPVEIHFLDRATTVALDEDTFAAGRLVRFEVAGMIHFSA